MTKRKSQRSHLPQVDSSLSSGELQAPLEIQRRHVFGWILDALAIKISPNIMKEERRKREEGMEKRERRFTSRVGFEFSWPQLSRMLTI